MAANTEWLFVNFAKQDGVSMFVKFDFVIQEDGKKPEIVRTESAGDAHHLNQVFQEELFKLKNKGWSIFSIDLVTRSAFMTRP